jgi:hypothetical protein
MLQRIEADPSSSLVDVSSPGYPPKPTQANQNAFDRPKKTKARYSTHLAPFPSSDRDLTAGTTAKKVTTPSGQNNIKDSEKTRKPAPHQPASQMHILFPLATGVDEALERERSSSALGTIEQHCFI